MIPDYEEMLERLYRSILKPGDIATDVSAHTGRHALPIARHEFLTRVASDTIPN